MAEFKFYPEPDDISERARRFLADYWAIGPLAREEPDFEIEWHSWNGKIWAEIGPLFGVGHFLNEPDQRVSHG